MVTTSMEVMELVVIIPNTSTLELVVTISTTKVMELVAITASIIIDKI